MAEPEVECWGQCRRQQGILQLKKHVTGNVARKALKHAD